MMFVFEVNLSTLDTAVAFEVEVLQNCHCWSFVKLSLYCYPYNTIANMNLSRSTSHKISYAYECHRLTVRSCNNDNIAATISCACKKKCFCSTRVLQTVVPRDFLMRSFMIYRWLHLNIRQHRWIFQWSDQPSVRLCSSIHTILTPMRTLGFHRMYLILWSRFWLHQQATSRVIARSAVRA